MIPFIPSLLGIGSSLSQSRFRNFFECFVQYDSQKCSAMLNWQAGGQVRLSGNCLGGIYS